MRQNICHFQGKVVPCDVALHTIQDTFNRIQVCLVGMESKNIMSMLQPKMLVLACSSCNNVKGLLWTDFL